MKRGVVCCYGGARIIAIVWSQFWVTNGGNRVK
jgi:hypothetical protein